MDESSDDEITRLARFCAALYRTVPLEGHGLTGQAEELVHAAELDADSETLTGRDVRIACQLLIDVRRAPNDRHPDEVALVREHFPEVEAPTLDALERLIRLYTSLLPDRDNDGD